MKPASCGSQVRRPDLDGDIPAQEKIPTASRLTAVHALRRPWNRRNDARRALQSPLSRVKLQIAMILMWLVVSAVLVTVALLVS